MFTQAKRKKFFDHVRREFYNGKMSQGHVDGINFILDEWELSGLTDLRWLAYMLATVYHETGQTMQPVEEIGRGAKRKYGKRVKMDGTAYKEAHIYFGRGYVQLTWWDNYYEMGRILHIDLINNPDLACQPAIAAKIMFEGMTTGKSYKGDFTGHHLAMYFSGKTEKPIGARKIINGTDCAELIADHYWKFKTGLILAAA